jgi:hypothetical protein
LPSRRRLGKRGIAGDGGTTLAFVAGIVVVVTLVLHARSHVLRIVGLGLLAAAAVLFVVAPMNLFHPISAYGGGDCGHAVHASQLPHEPQWADKPTLTECIALGKAYVQRGQTLYRWAVGCLFTACAAALLAWVWDRRDVAVRKPATIGDR